MQFLLLLTATLAVIDAAALPGFHFWKKKHCFYSMIAQCKNPTLNGKRVYCNPDGSLTIGGGQNIFIAGVPGTSGNAQGYYGGWNRGTSYGNVQIVNSQIVVGGASGSVAAGGSVSQANQGTSGGSVAQGNTGNTGGDGNGSSAGSVQGGSQTSAPSGSASGSVSGSASGSASGEITVSITPAKSVVVGQVQVCYACWVGGYFKIYSVPQACPKAIPIYLKAQDA